MLQRQDSSLRAVVGLQLVDNDTDVVPDGVLGQMQGLGGLAIALATPRTASTISADAMRQKMTRLGTRPGEWLPLHWQ
jgi:hypothetical protein